MRNLRYPFFGFCFSGALGRLLFAIICEERLKIIFGTQLPLINYYHGWLLDAPPWATAPARRTAGDRRYDQLAHQSEWCGTLRCIRGSDRSPISLDIIIVLLETCWNSVGIQSFENRDFLSFFLFSFILGVVWRLFFNIMFDWLVVKTALLFHFILISINTFFIKKAKTQT